jgi:NADPH:quinone reductase-like Zn-dependent oxidoreductase
MRAVYIAEFGDLENLEIREVADLDPPQGTRVLVRVRGAGLNRADLLQVRGLYPPPAGYSPNIPGLEFAGEVASVGSDVTKWQVGDRVFGITAGEAQAEYLLTDPHPREPKLYRGRSRARGFYNGPRRNIHTR